MIKFANRGGDQTSESASGFDLNDRVPGCPTDSSAIKWLISNMVDKF
jgi:hypothetical protein